MKWSWKLGDISGIGVYMHVTFLLLIAWVAFSYWIQAGSLTAADPFPYAFLPRLTGQGG